MATGVRTGPRISATMREGEQVTPLELFFDLVFVLALTQCTALMADQPNFEGLVKGLLVLAILWWSWVGYAWLTSVVNPEEGAVRLVIFAAMAAFLIASLCIPEAFAGLALEFAVAYAFVRVAHIALFLLASRDDPDLRRSVLGLAISTAGSVALLVGASAADGTLQGALWVAAIVVDTGGPLLFGQEGWKLVPQHFAERHGLIVIIALGESIVAIGAGVEGLSAGVVAAAILGITLAAAQWWAYFDVVALVAARHLVDTPPGREQNGIARDSYSLLHLPMVAGIVLIALALKKTLGDVDEPLKDAPALALSGGLAMYYLAHVAFRWRNVHTLSKQRLVAALACLALFPLALELPAIASTAIATAIAVVLVTYEAIRFRERREEIRHGLADGRAG